MKEIRNPDGRLICRMDVITKSIEILEKGWITVIQYKCNGTVKISHSAKKTI